MRAAVAAALALGLGVLAGCGEGDGAPSPVTSVPGTTTTPRAAIPTPTATSPATATATAPATTPTTDAPRAPSPTTEVDAGDEEPIRVPAAFTIAAAAIDPEQVTVPAFLAVEVRLTATDGRPHQVDVQVPGGRTVEVTPGATAQVTLEGLRPGAYPVLVDGGRLRGVLRVTQEDPGP